MSAIETPSGKNEETENFPVARFVRAKLRSHVMAFYTFARAADDISDNPLLEPEDKIKRLDAFAEALLDKNDASIPSVISLRESLQKTKVTPQHALDLLTAFKRDATKLRYENWDELLDYCRYSASPVGRHVLALHDIGKEAWEANDALCSALQITNHLQDCGDDYRELNRVYIPLDMMKTHAAHEGELAAPESSRALRQTINAMLEKLAPMIEKGGELPTHVPDTLLKIDTSVISVIAEYLADILQKRDPLCENVKLSKTKKLRAVLKGTVRAYL